MAPPRTKRTVDESSRLSTPEREMLMAFSAGLSRGEVADTMGLAEDSIDEHISAVLDKLHRLDARRRRVPGRSRTSRQPR